MMVTRRCGEIKKNPPVGQRKLPELFWLIQNTYLFHGEDAALLWKTGLSLKFGFHSLVKLRLIAIINLLFAAHVAYSNLFVGGVLRSTLCF